MPLSDNDINTTNITQETGVETGLFSELIGVPGLNVFSRYSPGQLGVDANKNVILTPPTSGYKLGDYRRYNHTANAPTWFTPSLYIGYAPGASSASVTLAIAMNELNIAAINSNVIYTGLSPAKYMIRCDCYSDSTSRTNGSGAVAGSWPFYIDMVAHTPLSGHSRQVNWILNTDESGNLINVTGIPVSGDCWRYFDLYFSNMAGDRLINFGQSRSAGFIDIHFRESVQPKVTVGYNFTPVPAPISGVTWTFVAPMISQTTSPCSATTPLQMTQGSSDFNFYIKAKGICGTPNPGTMWIAGITSCDIHLLVTMADGSTFDQLIADYISINAESAGYNCNGVLDGGRTWQYDWSARPYFANIVWSGTNYMCTA